MDGDLFNILKRVVDRIFHVFLGFVDDGFDFVVDRYNETTSAVRAVHDNKAASSRNRVYFTPEYNLFLAEKYSDR